MNTLADALSGLSTSDKAMPGIAPLAPRFEGKIACFDQTLSKTGAALLVCRASKLVPMRSMMFKPTTEEEGNEANFFKGVELHNAYRIWLVSHEVALVAHESPPVGGGKLMRPESSLMAALALRIACDGLGLPVVMVRPQDVKKRLTGNAKAEKKDVKLAIEQFIPEVSDLRPWNQDVSDAIGVGIVASERNT
jgi:Holliday junction resolvasome RuvABC endonuclease subunit